MKNKWMNECLPPSPASYTNPLLPTQTTPPYSSHDYNVCYCVNSFTLITIFSHGWKLFFAAVLCLGLCSCSHNFQTGLNSQLILKRYSYSKNCHAKCLTNNMYNIYNYNIYLRFCHLFIVTSSDFNSNIREVAYTFHEENYATCLHVTRVSSATAIKASLLCGIRI